jgi:hypothetical protein
LAWFLPVWPGFFGLAWFFRFGSVCFPVFLVWVRFCFFDSDL